MRCLRAASEAELVMLFWSLMVITNPPMITKNASCMPSQSSALWPRKSSFYKASSFLTARNWPRAATSTDSAQTQPQSNSSSYSTTGP
ncbi:hypothetical protein BJX65DRAFT_289726 [Aspergillus insuetus]